MEISTEDASKEDTKKITGLDDAGIRKLRRLYRAKGRISSRQPFSQAQAAELVEIVKYQRAHPHCSYEVAYDAVITSSVLNRILKNESDDFTPFAEQKLGPEKMEEFFNLFNALTDFLKPLDPASSELLISLEEFILAKIGLQAFNQTNLS